MSESIEDLRKLTTRSEENMFNYKINTFHHFQPQLFRIEFQSGLADRLIYCYDSVTQNSNFDMKHGINCLSKFMEYEKTY